ncbi:MAG TPA: hypothetical protein PKK82_02840 [Anaerolineaceae bacterium]|nr:hypothetical protein [Chloroflexota bacterium]HNY83769.1 hypothetical protein [Anaerolineaceae bacterium]
MNKALFQGLIFDTDDQPLETVVVGDEAFYVLDDDGFLRHIPAMHVDRQVWDVITAHIDGNEEILSQQAAKMMGQEDIFTVAVIRNQLENKEKQFQDLSKSGIPEDARSYLGMMGFKAIVDHHGEVLNVVQPGIVSEDGEE